MHSAGFIMYIFSYFLLEVRNERRGIFPRINSRLILLCYFRLCFDVRFISIQTNIFLAGKNIGSLAKS